MNELQLLGTKILEKKYDVAKKVHENRIDGITEEEKQQLAQIQEEILNIRANFIGLFGETLKDQLNKDQSFEKFLGWGREIGKR
jgi:rsbT co-antagonist protein RsbR